MKRRSFLERCGVSAAALGLGAHRAFAEKGVKRPKRILFLMTDQHRPDSLGLFGDPYAVTPHLDRLAQEGLSFRKAYCQYPLCVPARTSILLGRYPHSISSGIWGNSLRNPDQTSFLQLLQQAGWQTACFGKLHVHQRNKQDWTTLNELKKWNPQEKIKKSAELEPYRVSPSPQLQPKIVPELPYGAPSPYRKEAHHEWQIKESVIQYMKEHRDENWFLQCSFIKPHPPLNPPPEYWDRFKEMPFVLPDYPENDLEDTAHTGKMEAQGLGSPTEQQIRDAMIGYYACVNFCDEMFGEVLAALDELGLREDTLVVYTSDHGEMLWDHRLWHKNVFFEESVRIPLLMRMPGLIPSGKQSQALVEHIDFFPTFCELAGIPLPESAQGQSLVPVLTGQRENHKDRVYSEAFYWGENSGKVAMMYDGRYKIIDNGESVMCELYDLEKDPQEITNVAGHSAYAALASGLLSELREWRRKDPGPEVKGGDAKTNAWLGTVLEPDADADFLIDAGGLGKDARRSTPSKWTRVFTVPSGSFESGSTYEVILEWVSRELQEGSQFFLSMTAEKQSGQKNDITTWTAAEGESGTLRKMVSTGDYDGWQLAAGVIGLGYLQVKRIRVRKQL